MALLDLLGRRWALRILYELRQGPLGFRELQERCDSMSTSVLSQRLGELREAGIVEPATDGGYSLTAAGKRLLRPLGELDRWAKRSAYRKGPVRR
jgi:DNA-binding HxlR family transcriptional regulator